MDSQKRTRFLAIPHTRSMHDLPRQTILPAPPAYLTRPVSFCPMPGSEQESVPSSKNNRRFSELPAQLDLGLPFGSLLLEGENFSRDSPEAFPNLCRLSHYHATSSSSPLSESALLSIENSSFTSSACTAPTSPIDSDGRSSFYESAALDFPEPPPIGSPLIRRMRSSPWFLSADEVDGVLSIPSRGGRLALDRLRRQSYISSNGLKAGSIKSTQNDFGYLAENPLGFRADPVARGISTNRDSLDVGAMLSHRRNSAFLDSTPSAQAEISPWFQSDAKKDNPKEVPHTQSSSTPYGRLPRIIRKVASMRSESHRTQETDAPNVLSMSVQRPVPRVRSFRSILPGSEPPGARQDSPQLNKKPFFWMGQTVHTSKAKIDANAEKDKQWRQSTNHEVYENNPPGLGLTARPSFEHGTGWKEDFNKSFIDISPDRTSRSKGRGIIGKERIKALLSKANGIFSWGRSQRKGTLRQGGRDPQA